MKQNSKLIISGMVTGRANGSVTVKVYPPAECRDCGVCLEGKENIIRIITDKEFNKSDRVLIDISCSFILKTSFLLYFLPAVFTLLGFVAGYQWLGNMGGFAGALILLLLGYSGIKLYALKRYKPVIGIEKTC
ncbi:SoxR reducing system RseC family protein [Elusimicrobiota bacterium]